MKILWQALVLCCGVALFPSGCEAQFEPLQAAQTFQPKRLRGVVITEAALATAASVGLHLLWYKKFPRSPFHFFNDNGEWLQMDKVGHATTAYTLATMQHDLMRWSGVREAPAIVIGSLTAIVYMSMIEVMDGYSLHWGFSPGDMAANFSGISLFALQQAGWQEQRLALKFSFHFSPFARYNPKELGESWRSRIIKDYNGQTYWLSVRLKPFLPCRSSFPAFLNLAAGYGAEGMVGARANPTQVNGRVVPAFRRYRQFYLSPDVDLRGVRGNALVNGSALLLQFLKTPAPALEWNAVHGVRWHSFYY